MSIVKLLHLNPGQDERPDAFEVIVHDWFADVIIKAAVAHLAVARRATEAGDGTTLRERPAFFAIGLDEIFDDAGITFLNRWNVFTREIAVVHAFCQRTDEHRRRRGFEIIPLAFALIHHLPPDTGLR